MSDSQSLDPAIRRLTQALDMLEGAVERRTEHARKEDRLAAQVHALSADRSRLAAGLDQELARGKALEAANSDAVQRIDAMVAAIEQLLAKGGG